MNGFLPLSAIIGGLLIGLSAVSMMNFLKQICGISGMIDGILPPPSKDAGWRSAFLLGLLSGGIILKWFCPLAFEYTIPLSYPAIFIGGFLVGFGSRFGKGCTSGHGVCGIGRFACRSIGATLIFIATAMTVATAIHLMGVSL